MIKNNESQLYQSGQDIWSSTCYHLHRILVLAFIRILLTLNSFHCRTTYKWTLHVASQRWFHRRGQPNSMPDIPLFCQLPIYFGIWIVSEYIGCHLRKFVPSVYIYCTLESMDVHQNWNNLYILYLVVPVEDKTLARILLTGWRLIFFKVLNCEGECFCW